MYSVSSCWLTFFLVFICFHSRGSLLSPLPRESTAPAWAPAHLATSGFILPLAEQIHNLRTWRASQVFACLLPLCILCPSFPFEPLLRTFPECSPSSSPWYPAWALVWGVACDSTEGGQPFGHRGRGPTPFLLTQDNSYATWPPKQDRYVLVNKRRALQPRGCCSLLTDLSQSRFE